jgi:hypothetical protein
MTIASAISNEFAHNDLPSKTSPKSSYKTYNNIRGILVEVKRNFLKKPGNPPKVDCRVQFPNPLAKVGS